ncbi:MAG: Glyoxalase-like domain containing protein [Chloroflexi bacterium]|nr:Glyoxalase-like domain containing protein [Chloroflexota bacterium]
MINRLDHVAIRVTNLDRSIDFYERHFGLEPYAIHQGPIGPLKAIAYLKSPQGIVELMHATDGPPSEGFHFCFVSDDFDAAFDRLVEEGVPVKSEPRPTRAREAGEENWLRCVFSGPDGEEVELRGPTSRQS